MRKFLAIVLFLAVTLEVAAQNFVDSAEIYFEQGSKAINHTYMGNGESIDKMINLLRRLERDPQAQILSIEINSYASPEGDLRLNNALSQGRCEQTYNYIGRFCSLPDSIFTLRNNSVEWSMLRQMVEESQTPFAAEVIHIIDNVAEESYRRIKPTDRWKSLVDSRNKHLMDLRGGVPYRYMLRNIYPYMRKSSVVTVVYRIEREPIIKEQITIPTTLAAPLSIPAHPCEVAEPQPSAPSAPRTLLPVALKTNLLFDAATLINIEVEVPLGDRWSIAGEWIFPWWVNDDGTSSSKRNRTQLLNGNLEAKYWFGDRTNKAPLTGWYASLYAGGGLYDFERNAKGYQGEFFIAAGLSGGYAHTINKSGNLRMEYSLGVGYLQTDYRYYISEYYSSEWHPLRDYTGSYTWFGPTRARVSLVWLFEMGKNKKGGAR